MRKKRFMDSEDDDEAMVEHQVINVREFFAQTALPSVNLKQLAEALYTLSERGLWTDEVDSVSVEQVLQCWRVVEQVRKHGFPKALCM